MNTAVQSLAGVRELQRLSQQRFTIVGLMYAMIFHFILLAVGVATGYIQNDDAILSVRRPIIIRDMLPPPPSLQNLELPPGITIAPPENASRGIPVPVPNAEVSPEKTIASQTELSHFNDGQQFNGPEGTGSPAFVIPQHLDNDDAEPDTFKAVDIPPIPVKTVMPEYPPLAKQAGLEGTVWVKCLVDRYGRVRKTVILKSDSELFNDAAVGAAMQFVFKPAIMSTGPVAVWAAIPFRFVLNR